MYLQSLYSGLPLWDWGAENRLLVTPRELSPVSLSSAGGVQHCTPSVSTDPAAWVNSLGVSSFFPSSCIPPEIPQLQRKPWGAADESCFQASCSHAGHVQGSSGHQAGTINSLGLSVPLGSTAQPAQIPCWGPPCWEVPLQPRFSSLPDSFPSARNARNEV